MYTIKDVKDYIKESGVNDLEVYKFFSFAIRKTIHTDNIMFYDNSLNDFDDDDKVYDYSLMDYDEYSTTVEANCSGLSEEEFNEYHPNGVIVVVLS